MKSAGLKILRICLASLALALTSPLAHAFTIDTSATSTSPMTGLWNNPNEAGWGAAVVQQYGMMFVTMYVYDGSGNPVWYVASACPVAGNGCTGPLYKVSGGSAPTVAWNAPNKLVGTVGSLTLTFSDMNTGTMAYTINGASASRPVTRDVFATAGTAAPAIYSDLYAQLSGDLDDFQVAIGAVSTGAKKPTSFAAQLTYANSNNGPSLLNASSMTLINQELDFLKTMGVQAVSVEVSFPMLNATFLGSSQSQWATFYGNVAAAVRARGFKLIVESQSMIPSGLQSSAWGSQLQTFYPTMNFTQYVAARSATAAVVAGTMKPDYFVLQEEPDTESNQAGQPSAGTVAGSTTMLNASQAAVAGLVPGMKVGAGFGSWLAAYQQFANSFTRTACSASQPCISAPLDFLDLHLFPVIEHAVTCGAGVACPPGVTNFWQNAMSTVATANAAGMHMTISQAWLRKVRDGEWPPLGGTGDIEEAREAYDFWAPLDQRFLKSMHDLATYQGMFWIAPFNTQNFSSYLQWSNANGISGDCGSGPSPCGTLSTSQVFAAVQSAAIAALPQGTYTSTGQYWHDLIASSTGAPAFTIDTSSLSSSPMTGLWNNPNEPGWGAAVVQQYGMMFVTMYVYDGSGNPVWYVASACPVAGNGCTGPLYKVTGGSAPTVAWNAPNKIVTPVGTLTMTFSDVNTGTMAYSINGVSASRTIARDVFASAP